jgi:3-isopropylmalate/(R)-2-methylmalate dehydratase small subunit
MTKPKYSKISTPLNGYAWCFNDNISTDDIISGVHLSHPTIQEMASFTFANIRPDFAKKVKKNDIVVGGHNFGIGSSREEAPAVLRMLGVGAIIAVSFARIFFRNAFNLGLPAIELPELGSDSELIHDGDQLKIHLDEGTILNLQTGKTMHFNPIPSFLLDYIKAGGAIPLLKDKLAQKL